MTLFHGRGQVTADILKRTTVRKTRAYFAKGAAEMSIWLFFPAWGDICRAQEENIVRQQRANHATPHIQQPENTGYFRQIPIWHAGCT